MPFLPSVKPFLTIIGGSVFLALYPNKIHREELDMQRIVEANALEAAFEQYLLHQATRAKMIKEQEEAEETGGQEEEV